MYIKINSVFITHNFKVFNDDLIVVYRGEKKNHISVLDLNGNLKTSLDKYSAYDFFRYSDNIIFTSDEVDKSYCYFRANNKIKHLSYLLHIKGLFYNNQYLCFSEIEGTETFAIISLKTLEIIHTLGNNIGFGNVKKWFGDILVSTKDWCSIIGVFDLSNKCIWQKDLSKLCSYQNKKTRIEEVFNDDTYLYVLVGLSVVKLEISTGNIVWNIPLGTSQSTGLLKDGFLYTTSNATLNKICIKTGKVIYALFPIDFLLENNYNINGGMRALVWNDNYIWTIMHTYPETILKINPDNGNIEDILSLPELGVTSTALEIQFHKDKLYISDIDGNLHILEKEEAI